MKYKVKFHSKYANKKVNKIWLVGITFATFLCAALIGYISMILLDRVKLLLANVILLIIILIGVFFDLLGIAVTAADEIPFHSMASNKVGGAKESILLIRNAGIVANFCNDVIGDICGIISGTATGVIIIKLNETFSIESTILSILLSAVVAAITVGGKAIGKEIALRHSNYIVFIIGRMIEHCIYFISLLPFKKSNPN